MARIVSKTFEYSLRFKRYENVSNINIVLHGKRYTPLFNSPKNMIDYGHPNFSYKGFGTSASNYDMFSVQDEEDFQERVIKSDVPVIVDFHANWCGPCKLLGPRLENIIGGKEDKVHLAKIDIDSVSDLALEYGVSAVPCVLGIKNGKVVDKFVGLQEERNIDAFVNKLIGK